MATFPALCDSSNLHCPEKRLNWTLDTFPSEVIGSIAEYAGIRGVANLWCCGSPFLNQKLSSSDGIQQIIIDDRICTLGDWFPSDLRLLHGVKLIRAHFRSACHPSLSPLIKPRKLASLSHLQAIDFSFEEALTCWGTENNKSTPFSFRRDLPSLTSLQLSLPFVKVASLTSSNMYRDFSVSLATDFVNSHISDLPVSLTRLSLDFPWDTLVRSLDRVSLPTTLEDVLLGPQKSLNLGFLFKLPFLTRLSLPRVAAVVFEPKTTYPPSLLKILSMPCCTQITPTALSTSSSGDALLQCFPLLNELEVYWMAAVDWRSIPCWSSLRRLKIFGKDELFSPFLSIGSLGAAREFGCNFFPPNLLVLDMQNIRPSRVPWVAFLRLFICDPSLGFSSTLEELYLPKIELAPSTVAKLPSQLKKLGVCWTGGAEHLICQKISPNLRVLYAFENFNQITATNSFTTCERHLPTTLTTFIDMTGVYTNVNGRFLDPSLAARYNMPLALTYLLHYGSPATIDAIYAVKTLYNAIRYGSMDVLNWITSQTPDLLFGYRCADDQPLRLRLETLQNLMKASIRYQQISALKWLHHFGFSFGSHAILSGDMKMLHDPLLIDHGRVPPRQQIEPLNFADSLFNLPLAIAIEYGNVEICAYLLQNFPMDAIWKKRRKIRARKIAPLPKSRKRSSSASSSGSTRSNGSDNAYVSEPSDDDYDFVEVVTEETLEAVAEENHLLDDCSMPPLSRSPDLSSDTTSEEEEEQGPGTPLTLALIWRKLPVIHWLLEHGYAGLSWKIIFKTTLQTGTLDHLAQLSELGIEIPKKRFKLFFEALSHSYAVNPINILIWLSKHGLDPADVRGMLPNWELGTYNPNKSAPRNENLATWLFRHFRTRFHQIGKQGLFQLCQWLHAHKVDIFQLYDQKTGRIFIFEFAAEVKDAVILDWLETVQKAQNNGFVPNPDRGTHATSIGSVETNSSVN